MRMSRAKLAGLPKIDRDEEWGVKEAARYLGVHVNWVYARIRELPGAFHLGGRWRFHPEPLRAWYRSLGNKQKVEEAS